jgi:DoxX-like family
MKRDKIIYWITTGLISAGMLMSAGMYLSRNAELMENFKALSIPLYFVTMLGAAKLLGAITLVAPVWSKLKEWAYAGFAFVFLGAAWTHFATGTSAVAPLLFLALLGVSYFFRLRIQ